VSTPITNIPQGLLSLLGLRDSGAVPRFVPSDIQAGIDVTQFLLLNRESVAGTIAASTVVTLQPTETTVPAGELWYVHASQAGCPALAAGETIRLAVAYSLSTLAAVVNVSGFQEATAGHRAMPQAGGYWVPAGGGIAARVMEITTAGTISITVTAIITRLRI
jgi:hypothetical protein